jgi:hypothetical protein
VNRSLLRKLFLSLVVLPLIAACDRSVDPAVRAKLAAHDAVLNELPRGFYEPGLGDLMHALQLRHAKLWFAGTRQNWELAAFELEELHESLDRVARWHADSEEVPMAPSIKAYMQTGRYALAQSITRKNADEFAAAFDRFTEGCNACHKASKHSFIVIRRPTAEPYGNQQYAPVPGVDGQR